jgi:hypothetical protein
MGIAAKCEAAALSLKVAAQGAGFSDKVQHPGEDHNENELAPWTFPRLACAFARMDLCDWMERILPQALEHGLGNAIGAH